MIDRTTPTGTILVIEEGDVWVGPFNPTLGRRLYMYPDGNLGLGDVINNTFTVLPPTSTTIPLYAYMLCRASSAWQAAYWVEGDSSNGGRLIDRAPSEYEDIYQHIRCLFAHTPLFSATNWEFWALVYCMGRVSTGRKR